MKKHLSPDQARAAVLSRRQLEVKGWRSRDVDRGLASGRIRRLQRNRYIQESLWRELWPESRHLVEVVAAHAEMRDGGAVAAYHSAGVLWGLPMYRHEFSPIHVTVPQGARSSSRSGLFRHREPLPDGDVTEEAGIPCTTLERTTFDVVRVVSREAAVAFADAALRRVAWSEERYDFGAAEQWREAMRNRIASCAGARGIRQAAEVVEFADGRAELPGESVTRLQLARLGFGRFGLQVSVLGPNGSDYRVDLELEEIETFLEFDGQGKYLDDSLRSGKSIEDVLLAEKRREDWIRGTTQKRLVRVEDPHLATPDTLAARLGAFGILPPAR